MKKKELAQLIFDELKRQAAYLPASTDSSYIWDQGDLNEVILDGVFNFEKLAERIISHKPMTDGEHYTSIKEVCSIANSPTVRVLWGDDTVTEVSIIHQAELVHRMGAGMPTKKFGDEPKVEKSA